MFRGEAKFLNWYQICTKVMKEHFVLSFSAGLCEDGVLVVKENITSGEEVEKDEEVRE